MRMLLTYLSIAAVIAIGYSASAQNYSTESKKAIKHYEEAHELFYRKRAPEAAYDEAIKALKADPEFSEANFLMGRILEGVRRAEANFYFMKAIETNPSNPSYAPYMVRIAQALLNDGDYEKARQFSSYYLALNMPDEKQSRKARKIAQDSEFALNYAEKSFDVEFLPLDENLNTFGLQYYPALTADEQFIYFTGRLSESGRHDENFYYCEREEEGWGEPQFIRELNTHVNEGTCTISADGNMMVFTVCGPSRMRRPVGSCDLYVSYRKGGEWSEAVNIGESVNTRFYESQPTLSADGRTLYFASSRPGGYGGLDIWMSRRNESGEWAEPVNLGEGINTPSEEGMPQLHSSGTKLYFTSQGHPGFGGRDIYYCDWKDGSWSKPQNMGKPINDHRNQEALFVTADGKRGFYAQDTAIGRQRQTHIIQFTLPEELQVKRPADVVKGEVYDEATGQKVEARVELYDLATEERVSFVHSDPVNGSYLIVLTEGKEYALYVNKEGYLFKSLSFDYQREGQPKVIEVDIPLEPIKAGKRVRLNNVFFAFNSYELEEKSKVELRRVLAFMRENPGLKIEIGGHTDSEGSEAFNLELSGKRAQSVVDFLLANGLSIERLSAKGYGESVPLASNDEEEGRAQNRRIEFRIVD